MTSQSQDDSALDLPKPMARFRSVENIASTNRETEDFVPVPAPRRSSVIEKENENAAKPLPTPRRNVQNAYIDNEESKPQPGGPPPPTAPRPKSTVIDRKLPPVPKAPETSENIYSPPPTAPRPQSSIIDRELPPVPKTPEISDNHYAAIQTIDIRNAEAAKISLGQMAKSDVSEAKTVRGPPPVPKRTDHIVANSLLDEPISPIKETAPPDPFDTSGMSHLIPRKVPLVPEGSSGSAEKVNSFSIPVVPPRPMDSSVPPDDNYISPVSENFINHDDGLNDYGVIWPTEPGFSPPPAPPNLPCPSNPPPPPPRADSSLPFENELPTGLGLATAPPIPARPVIPPDFDFTNEDAVFNGPPVPSRPAPLPPVPKRPDC